MNEFIPGEKNRSMIQRAVLLLSYIVYLQIVQNIIPLLG